MTVWIGGVTFRFPACAIGEGAAGFGRACSDGGPMTGCGTHDDIGGDAAISRFGN